MERETQTQNARIAWSIADISKLTGLSPGFLRNEQRAGRLPIKRFGRRILVLDQDLQNYLSQGSKRASELKGAA